MVPGRRRLELDLALHDRRVFVVIPATSLIRIIMLLLLLSVRRGIDFVAWAVVAVAAAFERLQEHAGVEESIY